MQRVQLQLREIQHVLESEVIKRDILESPEYAEASALVRGARVSRSTDTEGTDAGTRKKQRRSPTRRSVRLGQVIEAGLLAAPTTIFRRYKGERVEAQVRSDGTIEWNGSVFDSPSMAAAAVRSRALGRTATANGWNFWRYLDSEGQPCPLADAREAYLDQAAEP